MNISSESLTRVTKPLRCTSLHQSILASSPSTRTQSLPFDSPLTSSTNDSNDEQSSQSCNSSDDESMNSQYDVAMEKDDSTVYLDTRRNNCVLERRHRRPSCGSSLKYKGKGLSLTYTSPTTTAHAINEVFSRRESTSNPFSASKSPEANRVSFLAELPDAIARARKVHYRRDALLPKTKSFNRVQNTLKEDSAPSESDIKKEATLAQILKGKVAACHEPTALEVLDQAMAGTDTKDAVKVLEQVEKPISMIEAGTLNEKFGGSLIPCDQDEPLFTMEDLNASSPKSLKAFTGQSDMTFIDHRSTRNNQNRASRPTKRKVDESRYEPYMSVTKRRAVSPSPGSPLGSSNLKVKGSIFRIEDLTL